jgi:hypothetical protein
MPLKDKVFSPFDETQIKELRRKRFKEIEIGRISREVIVYCVYFWILYVVCYSNSNQQTFKYQNNIKEIFISQSYIKAFNSVRNFSIIRFVYFNRLFTINYFNLD